MHRIFSVSAALLLLGLTPVTGMAASSVQRPVVNGNPSITFVDGWWEQEHQEQEARERYWHLRPQQMSRYNRIQAEQNRREQQRLRFERENRRALEEQHQMLRFEFR